MGRGEEENKRRLTVSDRDDGGLTHNDKLIQDGVQLQGNTLVLSTLPKTWILDLDGTLVKHNGYKIDGTDLLLDGVKKFIDAIPEEDFILILTSRTEEYRDSTVGFLKDNGVRYDEILFGMPMGERIVVNDRKPSGLDMAIAVNVERDKLKMPEIRREL